MLTPAPHPLTGQLKGRWTPMIHSAGLFIVWALLSQQTSAHLDFFFGPASQTPSYQHRTIATKCKQTASCNGQLQWHQSSGSWCRTRVGQWGRCAPFSECPLLQHGPWATAPPTTCLPLNSLPLVCCPLTARSSSSPRRRTTSERPSRNRSSAATPTTTVRTTVKTFRPTLTTTVLPPTTTAPPATTTPSPADHQYECGRPPGTPQSLSGSVVGGREAKPHSRPWMAALGERRGEDGSMFWFCGGILITPSTVLTAAHCLLSRQRVDVVRVGGHDLTSTTSSSHQDLPLASVVPHPRYRPPAVAHDLALLFLARPAVITTAVVPVCLPSLPPAGGGRGRSGALRSRGWSGLSMMVSGWGSQMFNGESSSVLREASVTVFPLTSCRKAYSRLPGFRRRFPGGLSESFVCAGDVRGGVDACKGDSGGPLVYEGGSGGAVLTGVVAAGYGCGHKQFPGLYTSTLAHLRWIQGQLRLKGQLDMLNT